MGCEDYTSNNVPVGVGYDSNGRAKSLMELQTIVVPSISATTYHNIPALGGPSELNDLSDVCDDVPSDGAVLAFDASIGLWCPSSLDLVAPTLSLSSLGDVCSSIPSTGQSLVYNGSEWCPSSISGGGGSTTFSALTDVTVDYSTDDGKVLVVNSDFDTVSAVQTIAHSNLPGSLSSLSQSMPSNSILISLSDDTTPLEARSTLQLSQIRNLVGSNTFTAGQYIVALNSNTLIASSVPTPTYTLESLTDTTNVGTASNGEMLFYDPSEGAWNVTPSPSDGQVLVWDSGTWTPSAITVGIGSVEWGNITGTLTDQGDLSSALNSLETDIASVSSDLNTLESDVSSLELTVSALAVDVLSLSADVLSLSGDVGDLETDVASLSSSKQNSDPLLTSIANLTTAANRMIYTTGVDTAAVTTLTAFARTILDDSNAAAVRATIDAPSTSHTHTAATVSLDDADWGGALVGQGISSVQDLADWIDANFPTP